MVLRASNNTHFFSDKIKFRKIIKKDMKLTQNNFLNHKLIKTSIREKKLYIFSVFTFFTYLKKGEIF
ncbi:MAG: hypothetical protein A2255_00080 [Candidatus Melainabacteria bacterium RIFOXYA2_FULL_32_9]|nr:MAG: hypothetical protein A2255_00080 [Candidatus Melainabacteria bacterium RIFOXYA2_FULL_32_9]